MEKVFKKFCHSSVLRKLLNIFLVQREKRESLLNQSSFLVYQWLKIEFYTEELSTNEKSW